MAANGIRFQGNAPAVQTGQSNASQMFGSLSSRLKAFAGEEENRLDQLMHKKAKEQGRIDQQGRTEITLRNGETIADNAWNEGARTSSAAALKVDLTSKLSRLEAANKLDTEGFDNGAKAYVGALVDRGGCLHMPSHVPR